MKRRLAVRAPLLLLAMASLLAALWAGLLRLGWRMPVPSAALPNLHGPLMVVGFLGTLVSLERAVALGRWWTYGAPLLLALGALAALFGVPGAGPAGAAAAGALVLVLVFAEILRRQPTLFNAVMAAGAAALLAGNLQWARMRPFFDSAYWWAGFLVLTIVGERLELSRLLRITPPSWRPSSSGRWPSRPAFASPSWTSPRAFAWPGRGCWAWPSGSWPSTSRAGPSAWPA